MPILQIRLEATDCSRVHFPKLRLEIHVSSQKLEGDSYEVVSKEGLPMGKVQGEGLVIS